MYTQRRICVFFALALFLWFNNLRAADFTPFRGEVNSSDINLRADATIYSESILKLNKQDSLEVVAEFYDWYKVRLPENTAVFIKKDYVALAGEKSGRVRGNNVNIRLRPSDSSLIVGKVSRDETVNILTEEFGWYKIEATKNSFGWIHKKFLDRVKAVDKKE